MRVFKTLMVLTVITLVACSSDDDNQEAERPAQGTISLALSNGGGFVVENLQASISTLYSNAMTTTITLSGTAGGSGNVVITIVDNDAAMQAIVSEGSIPVGNTSLPFYATVVFESNTFVLDATAGTLDIINYQEFPDQNYAVLSATFSAAGNSNSMTSSILDIVLDCSGC